MIPKALENAIRAIQDARSRMEQREKAHDEVVERKNKIAKESRTKLKANIDDHQLAVRGSIEHRLKGNY